MNRASRGQLQAKCGPTEEMWLLTAVFQRYQKTPENHLIQCVKSNSCQGLSLVPAKAGTVVIRGDSVVFLPY